MFVPSFALACGTTSWGVGGKDFWLVKTNATGHAEWNKTYGGVEFDYAGGITETSNGGYALFGVGVEYANNATYNVFINTI